MKRPSTLMKFGGTSMGDAACIKRAAEIAAASTKESAVVVVVSAMGGVTNRLGAAAQSSVEGDRHAAENVGDRMRGCRASREGHAARSANEALTLLPSCRDHLSTTFHLSCTPTQWPKRYPEQKCFC